MSSLVWGDKVLQGLSSATEGLPGGVRAAIPGAGRWRIYAINLPYPEWDPQTFRLKIDGLVDRPQSLSIADLRALPRAEQTSDFHCVTGWSVTNVRWAGVRFKDLMELCGPQDAATALQFTSMEKPYVDALSREQLRQPDAMLAYEMDGEPITREHGAPLRVVMPKMYGYKGVKWLDQITLAPRLEDGYWEQRGYDRDAWVDGAPV